MSDLHAISGCESSGRKADVLFLHGLGGDAFGTWRHGKDDSTSWPHWLGQDLPSVGVWSLEYAASPSRRLSLVRRIFSTKPQDVGHAMSLPDRARDVLNLLMYGGFGERPILMICHSLGGLLAKQILRRAKESTDARERAIFEATRGVLFLATPHTGAYLATLADQFRAVLGATASIEDLKAHDAHLRELHDWYRNQSREIRTVTYFESRDIAGARIVNETSAHPGIGSDPIPLDEDHLSIAKPRSPDARVCRAAKDMLGGMLSSTEPAVDTPSSPITSSVADTALPEVAVAGLRDLGPVIPVTTIPETPFDAQIKEKMRETLTDDDLTTLEGLLRQESASDGVTLGSGDLADLLCAPTVSLDHAVNWLTQAAVTYQRSLRRQKSDDILRFKERIQEVLGWLLLRAVNPLWLERHQALLRQPHGARVEVALRRPSCIEVAVSRTTPRDARFRRHDNGPFKVGDRSIQMGGEAGFEPPSSMEQVWKAIWRDVMRYPSPKSHEELVKDLKEKLRAQVVGRRHYYLTVAIDDQGSGVTEADLDTLHQELPELRLILIRAETGGDAPAALWLNEVRLDDYIHSFFSLVVEEKSTP